MGKSTTNTVQDSVVAESASIRVPARRPAAESDPVEEFRRRAEVYNRLYMSTPEKAKETLHRIGILTKTGKVAKNYR